MKFLPIVERELRVAARRGSTYWVRTWVAMLVILASTWIVLANLAEPPQTVAQILFFSVAGGAMLYCLLTGLRATADCLSEEKRDGTLGLLFLTDLKGFDVVAGKLVANSLNSFYGLMAILPVVALALLMGGLTGLQVGCAAVALVNTMFLSVCAGMFASACCRSAQRAILLTFGFLMALTVGIPALGWWSAARQGFQPNELYFVCSPIFTFISPYAMGAFGKGNLQMFAWSVGVVHTLGWIFLIFACLVAPRSWQEKPAGERRLRWSERWKLWSYGGAAERIGFRTRLLDRNAFFWLAARERLKPMWVWAFLGLVAFGWAWGCGEFKREWFNEGVYVATAFAMNSVLKSWLAAEAARQLTEERRAGSLELLLVTPLTIKELLHGQALGLRRQFTGPVVVVLLAELVMLLAILREAFDYHDRLMWIAWWGAGMISLVADLVALYWVGMWMGLSSKHPKRALSDTVGRVLAVPWVIFSICLLGMLLVATRGRTGMSWESLPFIWLALGLGADVGYGFWARHKLLSEFREAATRRYQQPVSWWKRLLGWDGAGSDVPATLE